MIAPLATEDRIIRLHDGRLLGYREFGDPGGYPIFLFHGIPGSRRGAGCIGDIAGSYGIRVISPDRPGIGLSTFQPRRSFLDWPHDVAELADSLGLDSFGVVGNSGGAAYVAACGALIPDRIEFAGVISGMGPIDIPDWQTWLRLPRLQRIMIRVARRAPYLACRIAGPILAREFDPTREDVLERMKATMARADATLLDDPRVAGAVLCDASEALRQGTLGVTWDFMLYSQPWGFRLEDVKVPVHLWHGEGDITVPPVFGRAMEALLPECEATYWPNEGHLMAAARAKDIIETISSAVHRPQRSQHTTPLLDATSTPILDAASNARHPTERLDHAGDRTSRASGTDKVTLPGGSRDRSRHHDRARDARSGAYRLHGPDSRPAH